MQTINISEFRANLLQYLEVAHAGKPISVTSNGRLLATITPPVEQKQAVKQQLADIANTAKIHDITSPIDTAWDALS